MKTRKAFAAFVRAASALLLALSACSLDRYHAQEATGLVQLQVPKALIEQKARVLGAPSTYTSIDCFVVDANASDIPPLYDNANPFASLDIGSISAWVSRASLVASGSTSLTLRVPIGRARTLRILGVTGASPITSCETQSFGGYPDSGVLASPPYPVVFELARTTVDVFTPKTATSVVAADASVDMMPANFLTVPPMGSGSYALLVGNSLSDYSEGAPPSVAGFSLISTPMTTGRLSGKARFDFVLPIGATTVKSFRGIQMKVLAAGGAAACAGGQPIAITTPSTLELALWQETAGQWTIKKTAIPISSQTTAQTLNFTGLNFDQVKVPVLLPVTDVQKIAFTKFGLPARPTQGTLTISWPGNPGPTASVTFGGGSEAADFQTSIRGIGGLEAATVTGDASNGFTISLVGASGNPPPTFTVSSNTASDGSATLTPTITETTVGGGTQQIYSIYLSMRVVDQPASGCSAINVTNVSTILYQ